MSLSSFRAAAIFALAWSVCAALTTSAFAVEQPRLPEEATGAAITSDVAVERTFHVSADGDDANPGTADAPFGTLQFALDTAVASKADGVATKLVIASGTYRESMRYTGPAVLNDVPLVVTADEIGGVTFDGADRWSDWQAEGENRWVADWPYDWKLDAQNVAKTPLYGRHEMVFIDGRLLRQVWSFDELEENTYHVDTDADRMTLQLTADVDPNTAETMVSIRDQLVYFQELDALVVRGINVTRSRVGSDGPIKWQSCKNVLIEDCAFNWNNKSGLRHNRCEDMTFRRVVANYNGRQGFFSSYNENVLFEDCGHSFNGWRADWGSAGGWDTHKWLRAHRFTLRNFTAVGNLCPGIWFDMDHENVLIEGAVVIGNRGRGIFLEAGQGPYAVYDSIVIQTQPVPAGYRFKYMAGLSLSTVRDVTIERNIFFDNVDRPEYGINAQVQIHDLAERGDIRHRVTEEPVNVEPHRIAIRRNVMLTNGRWQTGLAIPPLDADSMDPLRSSLTIDENLYWNLATGSDASAFKLIRGLGAHVTPPEIVAEMNLGQWQAATGYDTSSTFADPKFADPQRGDFTIAADSPVASWDLPTERLDSALLAFEKGLALLPQNPRRLQMIPTTEAQMPMQAEPGDNTPPAQPEPAETEPANTDPVATSATVSDQMPAGDAIAPALLIRYRDDQGNGTARRGNQVESPQGALRVGDADNDDEFRVVAVFEMSDMPELADGAQVLLTVSFDGEQRKPGFVGAFLLGGDITTEPDLATFAAPARRIGPDLDTASTDIVAIDVTEQVRTADGTFAIRFQSIADDLPSADGKGQNAFLSTQTLRLVITK